MHGPNIDEPLAAEIRRGWIYYHADGLGSITTLTSHMGNVVQKYEYDSFGNMRLKPHFIKQPYTYTAREFDPETGLYYYRARYYDAKAGRFINRDPIGFRGGINFYTYVKNNPVNLTDPMGLSTCEVTFNDCLEHAAKNDLICLRNVATGYMACTIGCAAFAPTPPILASCLAACSAAMVVAIDYCHFLLAYEIGSCLIDRYYCKKNQNDGRCK